MPISSRSEHGAYNLHGYPSILGLQTGRVGLSPIIQEFLMSWFDASMDAQIIDSWAIVQFNYPYKDYEDGRLW